METLAIQRNVPKELSELLQSVVNTAQESKNELDDGFQTVDLLPIATSAIKNLTDGLVGSKAIIGEIKSAPDLAALSIVDAAGRLWRVFK